MSFLEYLASHWLELVFSIISALLIAYCKSLHGTIKKYKNMAKEEDLEKLEELVDKKLKEKTDPINLELENAKLKFDAIKESYKYRLIALCQIYLERGHMTAKEYDQLNEMWKVYHDLGGNSQAEDYYHKVEKLPVE